MKFTELEITGFGVWHSLALRELADEMTVFYGPNEAGKTTLLEFVRSMLFGFSADRRERYLPPMSGAPGGGNLRVSSGGQSHRIARATDDGIERVEVIIDEDYRAPATQAALERLLGEVDEATYSSVFAFGLHEIQQLAVLSDTKAGELLYELSLGLDRRSLLDVVREVDASRNRLLSIDGRPSMVVQLASQRDRLEEDIAELRQATPRYVALHQDRSELDRQLAEGDAGAKQLEDKVHRHALAMTVADAWRRRAAVDAQISAARPTPPLPPGALRRLDAYKARYRACRGRMRALAAELRTLRGDQQRLAVNEALCRGAARIEALAEQQPWLDALRTQIAQLEETVAAAELEHESIGDRRLAGATAPSRVEQKTLFEQASAVSAARRKLRESLAKGDQGHRASQAAAAQLASQLGKNETGGLAKQLEQAGNLVTQFRRRIGLEERIDQLTRQQKELEEETYSSLEGQMLPAWLLGSLGAVFALGVALILAKLLLPSSLMGSMGWPLALLGALGTAGAAATKLLMERSAERSLDTAQNRLTQVTGQLATAKEDMAAIDAELPRGGGQLVSRLQTAEREVARLEQLLPLEAEREDGRRTAESGRASAQMLREDFRRARNAWRAALSKLGLPTTLRPRELKTFVRDANRRAKSAERLEGLRRELAARRGELAAVRSRIERLAVDVGSGAPAGEPLVQLRTLLSELRENEGRLAQRAALEKTIRTAERKRRRLKVKTRSLRKRREALLALAAAGSEKELRRRAQEQTELAALAEERAGLDHQIRLAIAGRMADDEIGPLLSVEAASGASASKTQLAALRGKLLELGERRGQLGEQMRILADDRKLAAKHIELAAVEERLKAAVRRWQVLAVCTQTLRTVREFYEREHQPAVLKEASRYLGPLTSGRYTRVWAPFGEELLKVEQADGASLDVEQLSRGTREQLFLSLRLALVAALAERGLELPLVMDDVLVNFDDERAQAAVGVLGQFARAGHQLLVFTCHRHLAEMFRAAGADVRELPDRRGPAESRPAPPKRRRTAVAAEIEVAPPKVIESPAVAPAAVEVPSIVEAPPAAPAPTPPVSQPPAPFPGRTPRPRPKRPRPTPPVRSVVETVPWSAEEFEGELADRVRRPDAEAAGMLSDDAEEAAAEDGYRADGTAAA